MLKVSEEKPNDEERYDEILNLIYFAFVTYLLGESSVTLKSIYIFKWLRLEIFFNIM